jgi:NADH:ubiquinone oxidoreductase subunit E
MTPLQQMVQEIAQVHGDSQESLLPILQEIMTREHVITEEAMVEVARLLNISAAHVYGTATFYSFLSTKPQGKYIIRVCKTITCSMRGKNQIIKEIEDLLKIKSGETTPDRLFTLLETNCLGQCHQSPALLINDVPYTALTPERVRDIILRYRTGETPTN